MKVLVTGATGFTGAALANKLLENDHEVRVIVRQQSKIPDSINKSKFEIVEGDITNRKDVERAVDGINTVFHVAAVYRTAGISDDIYWATHVKGTENLLNASLKANVDKFVHCSTVGVHGHIDKSLADENYRFKPGDIYQTTKLEGEKRVLEFHKSTGFPVTVVRPTAIYGPGDMRLLKLFKLASKSVTIVLGSGEIKYHMVYIDDLVQGFILASKFKKAVGESFIVGGKEILTLNELLNTISNLMNVSTKQIHVPALPFQIAGTICEKICIPLNINPPIYRRRVDFFTKSRAFDITKAQNILGYEPKTSIRDGLFKTLEWYKQKKLI
jgi:nucleoside-diphosphate-sugar epimerase